MKCDCVLNGLALAAFDGGQVELVRVFFYHSAHREGRPQGAHALFDGSNPIARQTIGRLLSIVQRNNLVLKNVIQAGCIGSILLSFTREFNFRTYRPTVFAVIAFTPPAIQNREIEHPFNAAF